MIKIHSIKIYNQKTVLEAAIERFRFLFAEFDNICFAVSGGKDSGITLQLGNMVAQEVNKTFSVMYLDLEAMYQETIRFVGGLKQVTKKNCDQFYWICLPLAEDNATSALNPEFITWDESAKEVWVRDIPIEAISVENNPFPFYEGIMDFNDFVDEFAVWLHEKKHAHKTAIVVGIRTDESIRRYLAVASDDKPKYQNKLWTTQMSNEIYNAYPIYDWKVQDVWGAVAKYDFEYNHVYDDMYKNGVPLSKARICQPFGMAQKAGLDQFRAIEPETWEKLLHRVEGVNFGAIYCRSSLFGQISSMKPKHLTWQQYTVFLLESIGLYEPEIMARYYQKIKYYFLWCAKNEGVSYAEVPEESKAEGISWKTIARAIESNDFYMTKLQFGYDKAGDQLLLKLRNKHHQMKIIGDGYVRPKTKERMLKLEEETNAENN